MATPRSTSPSARTRLVETADRLFYAYGIRTVGIDRVIAEAGVAKATLYAHFPAKDDLIVAVLKHRDEASTAFFQEAIARHRRTTPDGVRAFFASLADYVESPTFRGCAFQNAAVELADPAHPASGYTRDYKRRFRDFLTDLIEESVGVAGRASAPAISLLVEGALITCVVHGSPDSVAVARDAALTLLDARRRK